MKPLSILLVGLLAAASVGCGSKSEPQTGPMSQVQDATVQVTNNNWLDMVVYATRNGTRVRLGMVTSMDQEVFSLPSNLISNTNVQLIASPIGANRSYSSEPLNVWPGQRVQFIIENQLGTSNVSVW